MNFNLVRVIRKSYVTLLSSALVYTIFSGIMIVLSKVIENFLKKDHRLLVFGSSNGIWFGDNSRFLFEWTAQNKTEYNCVWLTHSKSVIKELKAKGYNTELTWSLKGILTLFRSRIGCYTNTLRDLSIDPWLFPSDIKLIALRHGKSVKGVQYSLKEFKLSEAETVNRQHERRLIKAVISTSALISEMTEQSLRIGDGKIFITGYPRNDSFFIKNEKDKMILGEFVGIDHTKIILYAPSWRNGRVATRFFPFDDFDHEALIREIEKKKILLLCRPHPNDSLRFPEIKTYLSNLSNSSEYIKLADADLFPDVYSLLPFVDCLITDYSATYHDFLICDRPMWFIPYDYEDYEKHNGFLYNYIKLLPGPNIDSLQRLIEELDDFSKGIDNYQEERRRLKNLIHKHQNGNSCERVFKLIASMYVKNN